MTNEMKIFEVENKNKFREQVIDWLRTNNYIDKNGTLTGQIDYDVAFDMKPDIQEGTNIPEDEFDDWFDACLLEDSLLPLLRSLGATTEENDIV